MNPAIPLLEAAREVKEVLEALNLKSVLIGGVAVFRWGQPRVTRDADFTVLCPFGDERPTVEAILARLPSRVPNAEEFAITNRVLLVKASNGRPVDIALGALPFEERVYERGSLFEFGPGITLRTCSAEDLVVMKSFAGRDIDLMDIKGIIKRQRGHLEWSLIERELKPLLELKEDREAWDRLMDFKRRADPA